MFHSIAPWYDFLNHLLSFQQDRLWRRSVTGFGYADASRPLRMLDLCTGTGDLALQFAKKAGRDDIIVGADFTQKMLQLAQQKARNKNVAYPFSLVCADALQLPFTDESFNLVTVAFGVRNFENLESGLREIVRVTKGSGRIIILEFSRPRAGLIRAVYGLYFRYILPVIGKLFTKTASYEYLRDSVLLFPEREEMKAVMESCGMRDVEMHPQTFGVSMIYIGKKIAKSESG